MEQLDLFAHTTRFLGFKLVLLGLFNQQGLEPAKTTVVVRITPSVEYVKLVLEGGRCGPAVGSARLTGCRVRGAMLLGDTDEEEVFENLIQDGLYVGHMVDHLLDPDVDIADFFE